MSKYKVVKSISFNTTNEDDKRYLERIQSLDNFSGYIKRLIDKDIRKRKVIKVEGPSNSGNTIKGTIMTRGTTLTLISE